MRETKRRAQGVPLDYYKRPDRIQKSKLFLSVIALVLSGVWAASGFNFGLGLNEGGQARVSHGELAAVHASWDQNCDACHVPFKPIDGKSWIGGLVGSSAASDAKCQVCHAGPAHNGSMKSEDVKSCAGCHHDHMGRDFPIARVADSDCASCHKDLKAHLADGKSTSFENTITAFAGDHPEFKALRTADKDPGRLKFNHKLHLTEGLLKNAGDRDAKTYAYIQDPSLRKRFMPAGAKETDKVRLDCASCHVSDKGDMSVSSFAGMPESLLPPRTDGEYMLPITYENQCKACHPLTFDVKSPALSVPHRLQPDAVRESIRAAYAGQYLSENPKFLEEPASSTTIPGRVLGQATRTARTEIEAAVRNAEKTVFTGKTTCLECHEYEGVDAEGIPKSIVPPAVPTVWFRHARFDHSAHRAVDCAQCHAGVRESSVKDTVLLPKIETCRKCHAPHVSPGLFSSSKTPVGGARHDCAECHKYHNGDHPDQGPGAELSDAKVDVDIDKFLAAAAAGSDAGSSAEAPEAAPAKKAAETPKK